jgi:cell wall-associated NlpC family hydrolase
MVEVPPHFFSVQYNGNSYPGAPGLSGFSEGANCQHFAYELLRYFGKKISEFRSSNLWEDEIVTFRVTELEPLDLLLYNREEQSRGAHVAVFLGNSKIIHLSKEQGRAIIWTHEEFLNNSRYRYFIGAKRVRDS